MDLKNPIIIPGTTRAGTTLISEALVRAGVDMYGDWCMPYCEDADTWSYGVAEIKINPPSMAQFPHKYDASLAFTDRLKGYAKRRRKQAKDSGKRWGFKDPIISRIMQPYLDVFPDAKWIFCVRNGLSCVWSQRKRGHMEHDDFGGLTRHTSYMFNFLTCMGMAGIEPFLYNYDGVQEDEEEALSEWLGFEVKFAEAFKRSVQSRKGGVGAGVAITDNEKGWM